MTNMRKRHLYPIISGKKKPKSDLDYLLLGSLIIVFAAELNVFRKVWQLVTTRAVRPFHHASTVN